jgi:hypothetical protein
MSRIRRTVSIVVSQESWRHAAQKCVALAVHWPVAYLGGHASHARILLGLQFRLNPISISFSNVRALALYHAGFSPTRAVANEVTP